MIQQMIKTIATGLGAGYLPKAPGTFGSLWGVAIFFLLQNSAWSLLFATTVLITIVATLASDRAERIFGQKDCQHIVIDEVAGQLFVYLFVPFSWINLLLGFLLFRLFDVIKIFPASWAQKNLKGGLGVVGDDVVAGLQGGLVLWSIQYFLR